MRHLRRYLLIIAFLPLLFGCKDKKVVVEVPPPPSVVEPGGGGGDNGGGGGTPPEWEANRGKVVRPTAGNGWTISTVREGITYYAFSGTDAVSGVKQEACAIDLDLSNPKYAVKLTRTTPAAVTSDVHKNNKAIVTVNAGYEAASIFIRVDGTNYSVIPNTQISTTGVPNWKSEAAFFCDGVRDVRIGGAGDFIRPYKAPTDYQNLVAKQRNYYIAQTDKYIISSSPMLVDDYNPVGTTFIDNTINNWSNLNSEDPQYHQRKRHPRTAVALTHDNHLILFVVDGRTTVSVGMSAKELTQFLVKYFNPQYALNMDGGGSTAMCVEGLGDSETHLVNKPCDSGGRADKQRARDTHFVILDTK